ncbi:hypothetical protein ACFLSX_04330 [Calditrichota bacterium]
MIRYTYVIIIILNLLTIALAQDVSFSGWGKTGLRIFDRNINEGYSQETYYEGKFQADIEFNKNIEAQLDFRGNSIDNSLEFREFSMKFKYSDKLQWKIGHIKKPFGYEQSVQRERLISVDRSNVYNTFAELGYGGRSVSIMAYRKFSKKYPEFPFSYYVSVSKDNSFNTSLTARGIYHDGKYSYGMSYMFQNFGGRIDIKTHGLTANFLIDKKNYTNSIEVFFVQDPVEGKIRDEHEKEGESEQNEIVYAAGAKLLTSLSFDTDADVIKKIEPLILVSYLVPDIDVTDNHVIQFLIGSNFYFTKKVMLRFNGDFRLTKNQYNDDYVTNQSRVIIELQARF